MTPHQAKHVALQLAAVHGPGVPIAADWPAGLREIDYREALDLAFDLGATTAGADLRAEELTPSTVAALARFRRGSRAALRARLVAALEDTERMHDDARWFREHVYARVQGDGLRRAIHLLDGANEDQAGHDVMAAAIMRGDASRGMLWQRYCRQAIADGKPADEARAVASERIGLNSDGSRP